MTNEWQQFKLGKICIKIGSGATPSGGKDAYRGGNTALIRSQNIHNNRFSRDGIVYINDNQAHDLRNVIVEQNDVLLNITGDSVARCCQVDPDILPARVNQHVAIIRTQPNLLDPRFLRYVLVSPSMQNHLLSLASAGATRNALTKTMIESLIINAPSIEKQRRIADILGTLDDKIELNQRMNATLEAMARALFKSWFVDFEPVRAKLDGRWQRGQSLPGLPAHLYDLFPDRLVDSELGEIPQGWGVGRLSDITINITKGTTPTQEDITTAPDSDIQINYIRVNSIDDDCAVLSSKLTTIPESVHTRVLKRSILMANDVLYTIAGTIGRIAMVEEWLLPANTNQAVAIIRPKPEIPQGFIMLTIRNEGFREELHNNIVQAVQANLSLGMLSNARVVVPPLSTLGQLFSPINSILSQISNNRTQSRTLTTLRDTLLPKLLSGEVEV